jgi:hypothetical protein
VLRHCVWLYCPSFKLATDFTTGTRNYILQLLEADSVLSATQLTLRATLSPTQFRNSAWAEGIHPHYRGAQLWYVCKSRPTIRYLGILSPNPAMPILFLGAVSPKGVMDICSGIHSKEHMLDGSSTSISSRRERLSHRMVPGDCRVV